MKKFFLLTIVAALFASCLPDENYYITEEHYNVKTETKKYSVTDEMWKVAVDARGDNYLYYTFDLPELTKHVFEKGVMDAYLYFIPEGMNESVLSPLPYSDFVVQENGYKYEEHITAEFGVGFVSFIVKVDDHEVGDVLAYLQHDFIVKLIW
ncbi:hypothetical protein LJC06_04475 [Bacteroidales bacterium OttesenSCG-928-I14]|nr:hypothetical protein [Bacteroidales bacterium OttesenSCG-928-I14]